MTSWPLYNIPHKATKGATLCLYSDAVTNEPVLIGLHSIDLGLEFTEPIEFRTRRQVNGSFPIVLSIQLDIPGISLPNENYPFISEQLPFIIYSGQYYDTTLNLMQPYTARTGRVLSYSTYAVWSDSRLLFLVQCDNFIESETVTLERIVFSA